MTLDAEMETPVFNSTCRIEPVAPDTPCIDVYERFMSNDALLCVAVVDSDRPVGLVSRSDIEVAMQHRWGRQTFRNKAIEVLMIEDPLVVDVDMPIGALNQQLTHKATVALLQGYIVMKDGRYFGVGTPMSLLRIVTDMLARTDVDADTPVLPDDGPCLLQTLGHGCPLPPTQKRCV